MQEKKKIIPRMTAPWRLSKSALAIIVASLIMASLLAVSTVRNLNKEEQLVHQLLLQEAMSLVRTFEAGARTTMLNAMEGTNPLITLVNETVKEESISYIRIVDELDRFIVGAGQWEETANRPKAVQVLHGSAPITTQMKEQNIFEVATRFNPLTGPGCQGAAVQNRWRSVCGQSGLPERTDIHPVIFIGLRTNELDAARHEDVHHALFMSGILFLLGSTGLYFLFLYQRMQVARTTLSNMELYAENVIESMPAGLLSLDRKGRVVSCNARTEELVGRTFQEMEGRPLDEICPACPLQELAARQGVMEWSVDLVSKDGAMVPVKVSSSALKDHTGAVVGTVLTLKDMREIRKMEEKLERSRRLAALGQMATGVAHEIRNPLGTLRGFAQYFRSQATEGSESRQYADLMMSEVDRLNQTISSMLQFSRQREPDCTVVDMGALLEKTVSLMAGDFQTHKLTLRTEIAEPVEIMADPDMLLQVLLNLIRNSIQATPAGGEVVVSVRQEDQSVRIQVKDNGQGMTESERNKMFDPFFTTRKKGTGLGLAVSHQIVEQHDGHFETESNPGQGTSITVVLPIHEDGKQDDRG